MPTQYETKIPFVFRKVKSRDLQPLNHYLFDRDVACLLKRSYSASSKGELAKDDFAMENFFGSVEEGSKVLENIAHAEWEDM